VTGGETGEDNNQPEKKTMTQLKLTVFDYTPGDKWSCGYLNLKAETPLGLFEWDETVPGPRHGEDNHELTVKLAGYEMDLECFPGYLDFEPPGKEGKWADAFANSRADVEQSLSDWFEEAQEALVEFLEEKTDDEE